MSAVRKIKPDAEVVAIGIGRRPIGRPSDYTPKIATEICDLLADGKSLRAICEQPRIPDRRTAERWLSQHEEFRRQYAHARQRQADHYAAEILEIVDAELPDDKERAYIEVANRKLRADSRKWIASKLSPRKYGRDGGLLDTPRDLDFSRCSDDDIAALIAEAARERESRGGSRHGSQTTAEWLAGILGEDVVERPCISSDPLTEDEWEAKHAGDENRARVAELLLRLNYIKAPDAPEFPIVNMRNAEE